MNSYSSVRSSKHIRVCKYGMCCEWRNFIFLDDFCIVLILINVEHKSSTRYYIYRRIRYEDGLVMMLYEVIEHKDIYESII